MALKISEECVACGACAEVCPEGAIAEGDSYVIDAAKCSECETCVDACPLGCIAKE